MNVTADWYWEGDVVETIAGSLSQEWWTIVGKAEHRPESAEWASGRQRWPDEATGYPSRNCRNTRHRN